ncbi:CbtA family protein [Halosolutus amylolyticus]|uniref:CbtA family protein n=1 Tax=Halosolutus amylolyticus TaxID=2932267 RepID=A0ABD5PMZ7_9EURY|nr:CbtA family protein [Halosolutus amylolyticus]
MLVDYLQRGVLAGTIGGVCYGGYLAAVANPLVEYMEELDHEAGHGHEHAHDATESAHAVSETTTAVVSVGSGVLWGILLGGLFALAFYFLEPALPGRGRVKAVVLAGAGFLTVSVTPWLVLPPATPGAEQALGPDARIVLYACLMVLGAIVATGSILGYRLTTARTGDWRVGVVAGVVPVVVTVAVLPLVTPTITTTPLPAALVTAFQGLTVLSQAALWAIVAASFAWLHDRARMVDDAASTKKEPIAA